MRKNILFITASLVMGSLLFAFRQLNRKDVYPPARTKTVISCGRDWSRLKDYLDNFDIPPVPGAGKYKWTITTKSDSAQFYFNQGINMYYSFHIIESMASFKKAAKFDPDAAMLYWAQALAYGPNINDVGYAASPDALIAIEMAVSKSGNCTPVEKMLIQAQRARYSPDSTIARSVLNQVYVDSMKKTYERFPQQPDVQALYADAMMLQHPWDLWTIEGRPKSWEPAIQDVLEKLLKQSPEHPGANHYYIHVMEPSPYYALAIPSADRLGSLTPALSHTVHMPSHIYLRSGNYEKGSAVNEDALKSYSQLLPLYAPVAQNDFLYVIHNLHMKTNNAMLAGRASYSIHAADETLKSIAPDYLQIPGALGNYVQYVYSTPMLVNIRFGKWTEILNMKKPADNLVYANLLWHFGQGMAFISKKNINSATIHLNAMKELAKDPVLALPFTPFSPALDGATIAMNILEGNVSWLKNDATNAIRLLEKAVSTEENMVYNEPRDWFLNPSHFLAAILLKQQKFDEALLVLEKDLSNNNDNVWALYGCWQALTGSKKTARAEKMLTKYNKAAVLSDFTLKGPAILD